MVEYLIVLIAFCGILIGNVLAYYTKEEVRDFKKYFVYGKWTVLILLAGLLIMYNFFLPVLIVGIIALSIKRIYLFLGLCMVLGMLMGNEMYLIIAGMVFLFGLIQGSIVKFNKKQVLVNFALFVLPWFFSSI